MVSVLKMKRTNAKAMEFHGQIVKKVWVEGGGWGVNWSTGELWWVNWVVYHCYRGNSLWNFHGKDRGTTKLEVQKDSL